MGSRSSVWPGGGPAGRLAGARRPGVGLGRRPPRSASGAVGPWRAGRPGGGYAPTGIFPSSQVNGRRHAFDAGVEEGRGQKDKAVAALGHLKTFLRLAGEVFEEAAAAAEKET